MEQVSETTSEHFENERHRIGDEIRNYPAPIAGCDAQFNYLLKERARITQKLHRLKAEAMPSSVGN